MTQSEVPTLGIERRAGLGKPERKRQARLGWRPAKAHVWSMFMEAWGQYEGMPVSSARLRLSRPGSGWSVTRQTVLPS